MRLVAACCCTCCCIVAATPSTATATAAGTTTTTTTTATVSVDAADATATPFAFVYGVDAQSGPNCGRVQGELAVDLSGPLHAAGATVIRTHDSDVLDWNAVFPHPGLNVSTDDPANYNFTAGDAYMRTIVGNGFAPYVRLGTSWGVPHAALPPSPAPVNLTALADVLVHIVRHYNDGWGGGDGDDGGSSSGGGSGSGSGSVITYVEIWNEPDSSCFNSSISSPANCGRFWNRTVDDFYDLVDSTARALKAYDPMLRVGTCGVAGIFNPENAYAWGLIQELGARGTPLDFFSWHGYIDRGDWYFTQQVLVRAALDRAFPPSGTSRPPVASHVTEWFPCIITSPTCTTLQDSAAGAAALASSLINMVASGVDLATLYPLAAGGGSSGWGLFDCESDPPHVVWRPLSRAFALFGELALQGRAAAGSNSLLHGGVVVTGSGSGDDDGDTPSLVQALAVRAGDGTGSASMRLLLAAPPGSNATTAVNVTLHNLDSLLPPSLPRLLSPPPSSSPSSTWQFTAEVVDGLTAGGPPRTVAGGVVRAAAAGGGSVQVAFPLAPPAVVLVRLDQVV